MTTKYEKGAGLERRIARLMQDSGVSVVRAAGSKGWAYGFPVDLVVLGKKRVILMQVKSGRSPRPEPVKDKPECVVFVSASYIHGWWHVSASDGRSFLSSSVKDVVGRIIRMADDEEAEA